MSLTALTQNPLPTLTFQTAEWDAIGPQIREFIAIPALACALYATFVLLCGASIYSLVQLNNRNRQTSRVLSIALLTLFCSTTIYTVTIFTARSDQILQQVILGGFYLWPILNPVDTSSAPLSDSLPGTTRYQFLYCAPTAALTINILLGDAIVCWRACVIWQYNKIVTGLCILLLLITLALGSVDTTYSCLVVGRNRYLSWTPDPNSNGTGGLYQGISYGVAATALSLVTNLFATCAVVARAWWSRRELRRYFATGPLTSQMEKVFSLLVESGMAYCALWSVALAWQAGTYHRGTIWYQGDGSFWDIFDVIVNGALVPLIAIYPTFIIVLVALNRSHIEKGFITPTQSSVNCFPLRPLAITVSTTETSGSDSLSQGLSTGLFVTGGDGVLSEDGPKGLGTHIGTLQVQKPGNIV